MEWVTKKKDEYITKQTEYYLQKPKEYQRIYKFSGRGHNDEVDAFRHSFMQGSMTKKYGINAAKYIGDDHEKNSANKNEVNMDLWNNNIGRETAFELKNELGFKYYTMKQNNFEDLLAKRLVSKMKNGELITNPNDKRVYSDSKIKSKEWQRFLNNAKDSENSRFTNLEPAKYDTSNQPVAGVANASAVADNTQMTVTYPQVVNAASSGSSWLGQLGNLLSGTANLVSSVVGIAAGLGTGSGGIINTLKGLFVGNATGTTPQASLYNMEVYGFPMFHTGGKVEVPKYKGGRNEMLAILQGGETVRTEAQEKELQDAKMKELLEEYAPMVSGENDETNPYEQVFGNNKSKTKDAKSPVLANKTRRDEETIIAIVADAWKSNRSGFRNALRYS